MYLKKTKWLKIKELYEYLLKRRKKFFSLLKIAQFSKEFMQKYTILCWWNYLNFCIAKGETIQVANGKVCNIITILSIIFTCIFFECLNMKCTSYAKYKTIIRVFCLNIIIISWIFENNIFIYVYVYLNFYYCNLSIFILMCICLPKINKYAVQCYIFKKICQVLKEGLSINFFI